MLRINPFAALRPQSNRASQVACVPYDVINTEEARQLAEGLPDSFLHVIRSEIDLPQDTNPYDAKVYERAKRNLDDLVNRRVLNREEKPTIYLYRQVMNHREQLGVVACCHIDDYLTDIIKKHEKTRKDKEDDRTRHVLTLKANAEPVFLAYRDQRDIDKLAARDTNDRPLFHFVAKDGVTHTLWTVRDPAPYIKEFAKLPAAYIADGHHRSASAARAGAELRSANPKHTGHEEYNWFLAVLFPASQLTIMPYNRVVADLAGQTADQVMKRIGDVGVITEVKAPMPEKPGVFCVYVGGKWSRVEIKPALIDKKDPIASLDVSLLQNLVLQPILNIGDPRTDKRIDFVGGIRGTAELENRVNSGAAAIAFSMYPTTIEQVFAVSDAGQIMPPKSTWFEPKLRSGLFVHTLD
ncbi:MAG TPA: DUF1015 family protein [Phycisphaerales bacterium]|nr:DUF1015 family protein [Phycisphaerales bacterium]